MSEEKRISIYEYQPEHFGDTILEGVLVDNIATHVVYRHHVPSGVFWTWNYRQLGASNGFSGPWNDAQKRVCEVMNPPTHTRVMSDIAKLTRTLLAEGQLRADAFDEAA
jgi:hypothetical protein